MGCRLCRDVNRGLGRNRAVCSRMEGESAWLRRSLACKAAGNRLQQSFGGEWFRDERLVFRNRLIVLVGVRTAVMGVHHFQTWFGLSQFVPQLDAGRTVRQADVSKQQIYF